MNEDEKQAFEEYIERLKADLDGFRARDAKVRAALEEQVKREIEQVKQWMKDNDMNDTEPKSKETEAIEAFTKYLKSAGRTTLFVKVGRYFVLQWGFDGDMEYPTNEVYSIQGIVQAHAMLKLIEEMQQLIDDNEFDPIQLIDEALENGERSVWDTAIYDGDDVEWWVYR